MGADAGDGGDVAGFEAAAAVHDRSLGERGRGHAVLAVQLKGEIVDAGDGECAVGEPAAAGNMLQGDAVAGLKGMAGGNNLAPGWCCAPVVMMGRAGTPSVNQVAPPFGLQVRKLSSKPQMVSGEAGSTAV